MDVSFQGVRWTPGFNFDRHVARSLGGAPALDVFLTGFDSDPAIGQFSLSSLPAGTDITSVVFRPVFNGAPSSADRGVEVVTGTGEIKLTPPAVASPKLNNFLLEIEIAHTSPLIPTPAREGLRVHVHDDIAEIWLAPNPLVGRQGAHRTHFTALAAFSDGVIGEVSDWMLMQVDDGTGHFIPRLGLRSSDASIAIDPADRAVQFVTVGGTATITADLTTTAGVATATARCEAPWSTPVQAKFIDGAGEDKLASVPNLLFLPDGFAASEKGKFEQLVTDAVRNGLARNKFLSPYNHLSRSINYWAAFVPSTTQAVSVLPEVSFLRPVGATFRGMPLDPPSRPPAAAAQWTLEQMIHQVGLPVAAQAGLSRADLVAQWQALYGPHVTDAKVSATVQTSSSTAIEMWQLWQQLADRALVNEVSTAFAVSIGGRQSADCVGSVPRLLLMDPKRMDFEDFDEFLRNLTFQHPVSGTTTPLGDLWPPIEDTDPAHPKAPGKDAGLVCIIARSRHHAGTNDQFMSFTSTIASEFEHPLKPAVTGRLDVVTGVAVAAKATTHLVTTVAHETAHSFHVGDEYCGDCARGQPDATDTFGNLQLAGENALVGPGPAVDATKIKWRWPRIEKAGVLDIALAAGPAANTFLITLRTGHSVFAVGENVRLRARPLTEHPQASFKLKVNVVAGNVVTAEQIEGLPVAIALGDFPAGSVLLKPLLPPGPVGPGEITLIHPDILAHITGTDGPLNAPGGAGAKRDCQVAFDANADEAFFNVQFANNLPPSMQTGTRAQPLWGSWIVGLYEGGNGFPCGIFHPTGACLMRSNAIPQRDLHGAVIKAGLDALGRSIPPPGTLYHFCPVCRYVIVDSVDPNKHPAIDAEYKTIFPR